VKVQSSDPRIPLLQILRQIGQEHKSAEKNIDIFEEDSQREAPDWQNAGIVTTSSDLAWTFLFRYRSCGKYLGMDLDIAISVV
jgi:hypothetical protein